MNEDFYHYELLTQSQQQRAFQYAEILILTQAMQMIPLVKSPFHRNNSIPINMPSEIGHIPLYYQQKENTVIYQDLMQYL